MFPLRPITGRVPPKLGRCRLLAAASFLCDSVFPFAAVFGARQAVHQSLSGNGASVTRETSNVSTSSMQATGYKWLCPGDAH